MTKQMRWIICACLLVVLSVVLALSLAGCGKQDPVVETQPQLWAGGTQHTFHSAVVTNTNGTAMDVSYYPSLGIQVNGIGTATVAFSATIDGSNWEPIEVVNIGTGAKSTSTTADGIFRLPVGDVRQIRCPISGWSSGTITVKGNAPVEGNYGLADVQLSANTGVNIGDVALAATATVTNVTGSSTIDIDYAPGVTFWLESVTLNLSSAPTTSENFTVIRDATDGSAYDVRLVNENLSTLAGGTKDLMYKPNPLLLCESGDQIDVDWANSDGRTYGILITIRSAD